MTTDERVKVRRVINRWAISCDGCEGDNFLLMMRPWALAADHTTAMMLARWHVSEHKANRCDSCHRTDPLPQVEVLDKHHANYNGSLYEFTTGRPVRIGTAVKR